MKNFIKYSLVIILASTILFSCKLKTDDGEGIVDPATDGTVVITGLVLSNYSGSAIINAVVKVYNDTLLANGTTDSNGEYSIELTVIEDTEFTLIVSNDGFISDTTTVFGIMDETADVPNIRLVPSTSGTVTFTGTVLNNTTGNVISSAVVKAFNEFISAETTTGAAGEFSLDMTIFEEGEFSIFAFKEGYSPDTTTAYALLDNTIAIPEFRLIPSEVVETGSGEAASIYLVSVSEGNLGIKESGNVETATLTFEVQDSSGIPIDLAHSVEVTLTITAGPGGGEFVFPETTATNADGRVTFTVNTGTAAGVMQVQAEIVMPTLTIHTLPIFFTIYGGFPVQERFTVVCDNLNYPFYTIVGEEISFTAFMGDQYTNPVRPETAVYFNVINGVGEGNGTIGIFSTSDDLGRATSTYVTWASPNHATYGPGFFEVQASTVDQNSTIITTSTVRLLSGPTIIYDVAPTTFAIANGGSQLFNFKVSDGNGNPLSAGTTINVTAQGGNLKSSLDGAITLLDVMANGPGLTEFSVLIYDDDATIDELKNATVKIAVTSPNGSDTYSVPGTTN